MAFVLTDRKPAHLMRFFEEISAIPRCSGNEKGISDYVVAFAKARGLEVFQDALWNVVVKKPGTPGNENLPAVMLQGHLDMVGEKTQDSTHDFEKDPLRLIVEGDTLRADGTTLGGDNGVAVAYMLAVLSDDTLVHPPLECVFTVEEETGLVGALGIDAGILTAKSLINMDCGPEGTFVTTCAGGLRIQLKGDLSRTAAKGTSFVLTVRGLLGGHSGVEIAQQRGNACKLLGRVWNELSKDFSIRLASMQGGGKDNVIPSFCSGTGYLLAGEMAELAAATQKMEDILKEELAETDAGVRVELVEGKAEPTMLTPEAQETVVGLLLALPTGVQAMNPSIEGLPALSLNLANIAVMESAYSIHISLRSDRDTRKLALAEEVEAIAKAFGATSERGSEYPGWAHNPESTLRKLCAETYREMYAKEPILTGTHGGLECGVFSYKMPGLDIVALGPNSADYHSVKETLDLASFSRVWDFLITILQKLCNA